MKLAVVRALAAVDAALDEILYRPAVAEAFRWLPRWWNCDRAKLSIRLDERRHTDHWKYRRLGVGRRTAEEIFGQFPGPWTVRQQQTNAAATAFWRSIIPFPYSEQRTGDEVMQEFSAR